MYTYPFMDTEAVTPILPLKSDGALYRKAVNKSQVPSSQLFDKCQRSQVKVYTLCTADKNTGCSLKGTVVRESTSSKTELQITKRPYGRAPATR